MRAAWLVEVSLVGLGGFIGSVGRYGLSGLVHRVVPSLTFPVGTLVVNVFGGFVIGVLGGMVETRQVLSSHARLFLFLGVLGGFTTFSTFGYETVSLLRDSEHLKALANVVLHIVVGLGAVIVGFGLSRLM